VDYASPVPLQVGSATRVFSARSMRAWVQAARSSIVVQRISCLNHIFGTETRL
jgi:hypothetical protein